MACAGQGEIGWDAAVRRACHRSNEPGFVQVDGVTRSGSECTGNRFFNTMSNLELNSCAGLLFIDFAARACL